MPCILPDDIKKLRAAITEKGGMGALRRMSMNDRIKLFSEYVDMPGHTETAKWLNLQIEEKLLKPGQVAATKEWLKKLEKKGKKIKQKDMIVDRILNKKDVMNPKGARPFMEGLAKQVMGFEINQENAKALFEKSTTINQLRKKLLSISPNYGKMTTAELNKAMDENKALRDARTELGNALVEFQKIYETISLEAQEAVLSQKGKTGKTINAISKVAGNIKSMKASVDFSFLRQLQSTAYVDFSSFKNAMSAGYKAWFESQAGVDTMLADILTRPNAINGNYNNFNIEVGIKEEAFPESWISEQIDKKGAEWFNVFRRSEASFNIAIQTARADLFDSMWERTKGDVKLLKSQDVGAFINTVTGRGKVKFLTSKDEVQNRIVNNLLFAPKWLASRIETLMDVKYIGEIGQTTPNAMRARNAVGNIIMMAGFVTAVKYAISALDDDDERTFWKFMEQTFDPRSSDFGKIVVGNTRFDLTTGTAAIVTLLSRVISGKTVDLSGVKKDAKWGTVVSNFLQGKASPGVRVVHDVYASTLGEGKNLQGKDIKWDSADAVAGNVMDFIAPISIQSIYETVSGAQKGELKGVDLWATSTGVVADFIGIAANSYDRAEKDFGKSDKAMKVEKRVAWATDKAPISAKLSDSLTIFRGKSDEQITKIREDFALLLGREEDKLINSPKFKSAGFAEKDEMLRDLRKKLYASFKKQYEPKKELKKKKK